MQRLIDGEVYAGQTATVGSVQRACENFYLEVSNWLGPLGAHALFSRALRQAHRDHGALSDVHVVPSAQPHIEGVPEASRRSGETETAAGLEQLLTAVIALLIRFIGEDLVTTLVEKSMTRRNRKTPSSGEQP